MRQAWRRYFGPSTMVTAAFIGPGTVTMCTTLTLLTTRTRARAILLGKTVEMTICSYRIESWLDTCTGALTVLMTTTMTSDVGQERRELFDEDTEYGSK